MQMSIDQQWIEILAILNGVCILLHIVETNHLLCRTDALKAVLYPEIEKMILWTFLNIVNISSFVSKDDIDVAHNQ